MARTFSTVLVPLVFLATTLGVGCTEAGKGGDTAAPSPGPAEAATDGGQTTDTGTGTGTAAGIPAVSASAGQLAIAVEGVDPATVEGYLVGMQDKKVEHGANGELYIDAVPAGEHDVIVVSGQVAVGALTTASSAYDRG